MVMNTTSKEFQARVNVYIDDLLAQVNRFETSRKSWTKREKWNNVETGEVLSQRLCPALAEPDRQPQTRISNPIPWNMRYAPMLIGADMMEKINKMGHEVQLDLFKKKLTIEECLININFITDETNSRFTRLTPV
ncbi:hypothetical protein GCK72_003075 [Caenorhabditis remanei]|uniref:Uncharacterized protein n=1 Tax=Caenorhabditis remanei TaxID=31234 RepID=A0A6A5HU34_CAERE|nr:hypothetical protein GCK72_003075 [Caenorhabditis remanei]KAF1771249.1 hypothetical protein GCK72_003075 [Caenorhabditis remanei]